MDKLKKQDCAYAAGFLDADGCVSVNKGWNRYIKGRHFYFMSVRIANTSKTTMDWFSENFEGTVTICQVSGPKRKRTLWYWRIEAKKAVAFLKCVYPYLKVKKEQARLALEFQKTMSKNTKHPTPIEVLEKRKWFMKEISHQKTIC